jgi:hypothetical protein
MSSFSLREDALYNDIAKIDGPGSFRKGAIRMVTKYGIAQASADRRVRAMAIKAKRAEKLHRFCLLPAFQLFTSPLRFSALGVLGHTTTNLLPQFHWPELLHSSGVKKLVYKRVWNPPLSDGQEFDTWSVKRGGLNARGFMLPNMVFVDSLFTLILLHNMIGGQEGP